MVNESRPDDLTTDLSRLAMSMEALTISEATDGGRLVDKRDWVVRTIRGYLIPRIENPTGPMTAVFAGPTGAGKSTLLNSVANSDHSVAGPLRPTTRAPLVLASAAHADGYASIGDVQCQVVVGRAPILNELTLVDTPDIDSTSIEHRAIAETMIDNADVVVYVTSAGRYSDLVPWEVLRRAHSRGVPVVHVLNRIRSSSSGALPDYNSRLHSEGFRSGVVAVHEHHMARGAQTLPRVVIQELRDRLVDVVGARKAGSVDTVHSVLDATMSEAGDVIAGVDETATAGVDATSHFKSELAVDLDRIKTRLRPSPGGSLELGPLWDLSGRRLRTSGMVRRRLPSSLAVARSHTLVDASLASAIDTDIRMQLGRQSQSRPDQGDRMPADTHTAVGVAIRAWHQDLDDMPMVRGAIDSHLASLLLARLCVEGDESLAGILYLLKGPGELAEQAVFARQRLVLHLGPVYTSVEYQVTSRLGMAMSADDAIYRARVSLSAVMARSSFAYA